MAELPRGLSWRPLLEEYGMTTERESVVVTPRKAVHPSTAEAFHRQQEKIALLRQRIAWHEVKLARETSQPRRVALRDQLQQLQQQLQEVQDADGSD